MPDVRTIDALGVLVLHGFTGSPGTMQPLTDGLRAAGFDVTAPTLPGHGTTIDDMVPTRWEDWSAAADASSASRTGQAVGYRSTVWPRYVSPAPRTHRKHA